MHSIVILVAKYFIVIPLVLLAVTWLRLPREAKRRAIVVYAAGVIITLALALIGRKLFNDPRPFVAGHFTPYFSHSSDNGFPSDHTLLAGVAACLTLLYNKYLGSLALVFAALVGASRVIAGVHHFLDIIGSLVFAFIGSQLAWMLVQRFSRHS